MTANPKIHAGIFVSLACLAMVVFAQTQGPKEEVVTGHARGTFDVKMTPQPADDKTEGAIGRYTSDKQFHGDLEGASKGEMLGAGSPATGSAGYVAMEKVSGTLQGRTGTFVLQHSGTMHKGTQRMTVTVVPGSGTGQLSGLGGTMTIKIAEGKHFYEFDYTLPDASH